jgi:hypothetical protein
MKRFLPCQLLFRLAGGGGGGWGMTPFHIDAMMNSLYYRFNVIWDFSNVISFRHLPGARSEIFGKNWLKKGLQCKVSSSIPSGQIKYGETVRLKKEE